MALPRHWNTSTNFHATNRRDPKASTSGNVTVNVRSLEPKFCIKFKQRRRYPYNADIISTLAQMLGQNRSMTFKSTWVEAHQDDDKLPGQVLSGAALINIAVDSLANDYLLATN